MQTLHKECSEVIAQFQTAPWSHIVTHDSVTGLVLLWILQVSGESLVCVGNSDESSADGNRLWEAPGLVNHAGTWFIVQSTVACGRCWCINSSALFCLIFYFRYNPPVILSSPSSMTGSADISTFKLNISKLNDYECSQENGLAMMSVCRKPNTAFKE